MNREALYHREGCLCEGCIVNHHKREPILAENQLCYRFGSDTFHHTISETQVLFVTGERYRGEKVRRGYEGPTLCPLDYVDYWRAEAQQGSFLCWIETWHVYPYFAQYGANLSLAQQHPTWGYWTKNNETLRKEATHDEE